jgi:hypothetical protein
MNAARALVAARSLAGMGYACFPCRLNKMPAIPKADGGNGFKDGTTDWDAIQAMWARHPGELVGVATGAMSGVSVLDIDRKHREAWQWWAQHRERLLPTRVHRTRSGGLHLLYRDREGLRNSESLICRGIDVRGDGGYIIWWPAAGFPVLEDNGIRAWPEWLMPLLQPAPAPVISQRALAVRDGDLRPVLHRAGGVLRTLANATEGDRNKLLYWAACRVCDMYQTNELDRPAAAQMLDLLREGAARIGLGQREAERTIASAFQRGAA